MAGVWRPGHAGWRLEHGSKVLRQEVEGWFWIRAWVLAPHDVTPLPPRPEFSWEK